MGFYLCNYLIFRKLRGGRGTGRPTHTWGGLAVSTPLRQDRIPLAYWQASPRC